MQRTGRERTTTTASLETSNNRIYRYRSIISDSCHTASLTNVNLNNEHSLV